MRKLGNITKSNHPILLAALALLWLGVAVSAIFTWLVEEPTIEVRWQTETEFETAGFNVLRSKNMDGPFIQINEGLISSAPDVTAGGEYTFIDDTIMTGETYYYRLEDVELDGDITQHELISAKAPGRSAWLLALGIISLIIATALAYLYLGGKPKKGDT